MSSDNDDSSSSDEEYVPPGLSSVLGLILCVVKLAKGVDSDSSSESEDQSECDDSAVESEDHVPDGSTRRSLRSKRDKNEDSKEFSTLDTEPDNEAKKAKEDAIWNEFLAEVDHAKPSQTTEVVRKYRFAGEEVHVTERLVPKTETLPSNGSAATISPKKMLNEPVKPSLRIRTNIRKPVLNTRVNLSNALQNFRALSSSKPPKLTTLEKSRLDWQNFVRKEDLEDDLKAHNKGKQGYLERQAFVDRATEREYEYQKAQRKRKL
ncbi:Craniofacial development protein 1 [Fasciola gigantica]|uniref:Craniofacial development protein 1 n=1 Tax=Fasciola gigantica TaxID=46835 RepID=A0A504YQF4_FASGI|nr:Craniofacial development protein 1 [Fasciola gigantica]